MIETTVGARVYFDDLELTAIGEVLYGISRTYEGPDDCPPDSVRSRISLEICMAEKGYFDAHENLIKQIHDRFNSGAAGTILINDESGNVIHKFDNARVVTDSVPQEDRFYKATVTVEFETVSKLSESTDKARVFSVCADGFEEILFTGFRKWNEDVTSEFASQKSMAITQTVHSLNADGIDYAPTGLSEADALAWLVARKNLIQQTAKQDGVKIKIGDSDPVEMRIKSFGAEVQCDKLLWSLACDRYCLPEDSVANIEVECTFEKNHENCEGFFSVSGTICSDTEENAKAKLEELKNSFMGSRSLLSERVTDRKVIDPDTCEDDWIELTFDFRFRDYSCEVCNFELTEDLDKNCEGGFDTLRLSGSVTAESIEAARAKILDLVTREDICWKVSESESIQYESVGMNAQTRLVRVSFSCEFKIRNQCVFASVTCDRSNDCFGQNQFSISGAVTAPNEAQAMAKANSYKVTGYLQISSRWAVTKEAIDLEGKDTQSEDRTYSFGFTYATPITAISCQWTRDETIDYKQLDIITTYSGTIKAPNRSLCVAKLDSIVTPPDGEAKLIRKQVTDQWRECDGESIFDGCNFTVVFEMDCEPLASIIDASVTVDCTYSVNHAVITPIPYGEPHVQQNVGWTPGRCVVSGNLTGRDDSAMISWAQARRSLRPAGGYDEPPQIRVSTQYRPYNQARVKLVTVNFSFPYQYPVLRL